MHARIEPTSKVPKLVDVLLGENDTMRYLNQTTSNEVNFQKSKT